MRVSVSQANGLNFQRREYVTIFRSPLSRTSILPEVLFLLLHLSVLVRTNAGGTSIPFTQYLILRLSRNYVSLRVDLDSGAPLEQI
jgi:hypothetical protein